MDYLTYMTRRFISFLHFVSVAIWFFYLYFKLWDFAKAAINLKYINVQTIAFVVYSFLLVLLPSAIIYTPRHSKKKLFKFVCFSIATTILVGCIGDLITYNFFYGYEFVEGDAIFCNIILNVPNIYGTLCCLVIAAAYYLLGVHITKKRVFATLLYLAIFLLCLIPPFIYSYSVLGKFPRHIWVEKAAFILPHQSVLLLALIISSTSGFLWQEHIR